MTPAQLVKAALEARANAHARRAEASFDLESLAPLADEGYFPNAEAPDPPLAPANIENLPEPARKACRAAGCGAATDGAWAP